MADRYTVEQHTDQLIVLKRLGLHLGSTKVVLQRSQIAAVSKGLGTITVSTTDGRTYLVNPGMSSKQRAVVRAAFGQ